MATFGGSGSLLACRLVDVLGLRGVVVPPDPGTVSAFGLLTVDVRDDHVQTHVTRHDTLDLAALARIYQGLEERAAAALDTEGFARAEQRYARTADLRGGRTVVHGFAPTGVARRSAADSPHGWPAARCK
jgi:N-methylhydantoinase A